MKKRLLSTALALIMVLSLLPSAALAASSVVIAPDKQPSDYQNTLTANGPTNDHGTIAKEVGDTGFFRRCPTNTLVGTGCGHTIGTVAPMDYCGIEVTLSEPGVIGDFSYSVGSLSGYDCLQMNFAALKAGTTKVTLTYYCNFGLTGGSGSCWCGRYTYVPANNTWYKYTDTFTVTVAAVDTDYTLSYDANGGEGAPAAQTGTSSTGSYTFTVSDAAPTRAEYDFQGWSTTAGGTVEYIGGSSLELFSSDPEEILYAVWAEHEHGDDCDDDGDGKCDNDGECLHEKDEDGYCTVENCDHDETCCTKAPDETSYPAPDGFTMAWLRELYMKVRINCGKNSSHSGTFTLYDSRAEGFKYSKVVENDGTNDEFPADEYPYQCFVSLDNDYWFALYKEAIASTEAKFPNMEHILVPDQTAGHMFYCDTDGYWWYEMYTDQGNTFTLNVTHK